MQLTPEEVQKIARLARIKLTDAEVQKYQTELSAILDYVEQLNEVNTDDIDPTSQVTGLENRWREDTVNYEFTREDMLESALETAEDHLKVKAVFADVIADKTEDTIEDVIKDSSVQEDIV